MAQVIAQDAVDQAAGAGQDLFGQVDRLIDGSRLGDAIEIQELVQAQSQEDSTCGSWRASGWARRPLRI